MHKLFFIVLIIFLLSSVSANIYRSKSSTTPQIDENINLKYLTDGDLSTYYVMRKPERGKGSFIDIDLDENKKLLGFYISAGCLADSTSFNKYSRLKSFWLTDGVYESNIINLPNFLPTFKQFVDSHYAEYDHQFIDPKLKYEYQAAIDSHHQFINQNMKSMERMLIPVILENPSKFNSLRLIPLYCYDRGQPDQLKLSEYNPLYEEIDNIKPNLIRDIANLFIKMRNEDISIFPKGIDSVVKMDYPTNISINAHELKEYCPVGDFIPRCIFDEQNGYLVVWNGYEQYRENGVSEYQFLVFRQIDNSWKLVGIDRALFGTIFEVMPVFINCFDVKVLEHRSDFEY